MYDYATNKSNAGYTNPNVFHTKKSVPKIGMTKAKQFVLWEEEIDKAYKTPDPFHYFPHDGGCRVDENRHAPNHVCVVNRTKGGNPNLGYGKKVTAEAIEITPGPSDYVNLTNVSSVAKLTFNRAYNNGGLNRP